MPHDFKFISTSLLKGLLFGIGFMAVAVAGSHYIAAVFDKPITVRIVDQMTATDKETKADFKKELTIVSHLFLREQRTQNQLQILCKIKNTGSNTWTGIEVQAELFNKGQYVDEYSGYIRILMPEEEDNFKITCGECGQDILPDYDKIELKIAAAHRDKWKKI